MRELFSQSRWLLLTGVVVIGGLVLYDQLATPEVPRDALAVAPADARIVARIDVGAVLSSHLFEALDEERGDAGVRRIEETCGYDPLEQIEDAYVFVLGPDAHPFEHLGFVAVGPMARGRDNRARLVDCVQRVLRDQGGAVSQVEIEGETAISSAHGHSHAAFLGSDGVVGGDRAVVASAIRVLRDGEPSALGQEDLRRLWARVGADADAVVVARLPERWLPAVRRMARGLGGDLEALASVRAFGLGLRLRAGFYLGAALETRSSRDAQRLDAALRGQIEGLLEDPVTRLSVVGRALRRIDTQAEGSEVVVTARLTDGQVDQLLELWRELRRQARDEGNAAPARGAGAEVELEAAPEPNSAEPPAVPEADPESDEPPPEAPDGPRLDEPAESPHSM